MKCHLPSVPCVEMAVVAAGGGLERLLGSSFLAAFGASASESVCALRVLHEPEQSPHQPPRWRANPEGSGGSNTVPLVASCVPLGPLHIRAQ